MPLPSSVRQYADAALLQQRVKFEPRFEVEHLATINAMVVAGLGVAALPELAAGVAHRSGLVQRSLVEPDLRRPVGLVTRRGRGLSMPGAAMVDILHQEMLRLAPDREAGHGCTLGTAAVP